jgi:hypothetical protein
MAPLLHQKIFIAFLSKLRFARDYTKRCLGRLALLLAFLASTSGRKFSKWWHSRPGNSGTSQTPKPADPPFLGTKANSYSVSGRPEIVKEYTVAASSVPASASHPSHHERVERHPATAAPLVDATRVGTTPLASGRDPVNRRSASMGSTQSRASDRFSIITTSRDSTHDEPSRLSRGVHRQFGRGPESADPSRSRERISRPSSRPNTPSTRPHTPSNPPSLEIITNLPSAADESGGVGPLVPPSASSASTHQLLSPLALNEVRRRLSSTSIVANVQNPSTESLPMDPHDEPVPALPTTSSAATLDYYLPDGRFVQLINSNQIPRYAKCASMQVECATLSPYPYVSLQTSRGHTL